MDRFILTRPHTERYMWWPYLWARVVFHRVLWLVRYYSLYLLITYPYVWTERVVCLQIIAYYIGKLTVYPMPAYYKTTYSSWKSGQTCGWWNSTLQSMSHLLFQTNCLHALTISYKFCDGILTHISEAKYLGLTLDQHLSFNKHIDTICKKANASLSFIGHNTHFCSHSVKLGAYKTYVLPIMEYALVTAHSNQYQQTRICSKKGHTICNVQLRWNVGMLVKCVVKVTFESIRSKAECLFSVNILQDNEQLGWCFSTWLYHSKPCTE